MTVDLVRAANLLIAVDKERGKLAYAFESTLVGGDINIGVNEQDALYAKDLFGINLFENTEYDGESVRDIAEIDIDLQVSASGDTVTFHPMQKYALWKACVVKTRDYTCEFEPIGENPMVTMLALGIDLETAQNIDDAVKEECQRKIDYVVEHNIDYIVYITRLAEKLGLISGDVDRLVSAIKRVAE